jgi:ribonuclease D
MSGQDLALPAEVASERDYRYIDTQASLNDWVGEALVKLSKGNDSRCCIDTEADSLHHFHEKLCLIQIAFSGHFALVDPLAIGDMSPLIDFFDRCELWLHGADYDLTMLRKAYGWSPKIIRDTQIGARLVGHRQFGLAALVENVFGHKLSKASQKEDWSRRPLPDTMLRYAVDDVRYLIPLADVLQAELKQKGREDWFLQSCISLQAGVAARTMAAKEDPWRVQGSGRLQPKGLSLLRAFWEWRDGVAAERDIPCFRVMSNKQMLDYALQYESGENIFPPGGWRPKWKRDFSEVLGVLAEADPRSFPQRQKKARGRLTEDSRQQVENLCKIRDIKAQELGIESSLLGSRSTLEQLIASPDGLADLLPWQRKALGEDLERIHAEVHSRSEANPVLG